METTKKDWEPKIVGFLCLWCSYSGADLAGSGRIKYSPNVRIIKVPCSSRVDPMFILKALQNGADGVLISGCHPGDCHYQTGNYNARRKFALTEKLLEMYGIDPRRVMFSWVAGSEGPKLAQVMNEITQTIKELGPNQMFLDQN